jgi:hypothetical protein
MEEEKVFDFLEEIDRAIKAGIKEAGPHLQGVKSASEALFEELKSKRKKFEEMEIRVGRKIRSGTRRTKGDPV